MKCKDIQSYGVCGKRVEFNSLDCYEASHTQERIENVLKTLHDCGRTGIDAMELDCILSSVSIFLKKISLKPESMPSIFAPEENEEDKES